ncbi:Rieske (2Fe-2S) protein [Corynebacterium sp. H128]|uniref:Rieske (2Fe-2S) protein n=1 Tax=Corynebacterium sp. H128 TaxID=3133427 RepID=UPI0030AC4743
MACSRRLFLLGTASTFAGAVLAACSAQEEPLPANAIKIKDVPVGSAVEVGNFIIAQPEKGTFIAYSSECPHQGGTVNIFENGKARCPEHNSQFDLSTGERVWGPAREDLTQAKLTQKDKALFAE